MLRDQGRAQEADVMIGLVIAALLLALATPALARPTHSDITPLAAAAELNGLDLYPLDVGRAWTYRDSTGRESRNVIANSTDTLVGAPITYERDSYDLSEPGHPKLVERWMFVRDPARGVLSQGGVETDDLKGPMRPAEPYVEIPRHLTADSVWFDPLEHRFAGVADVDVGAGSFKGCGVIDAKGEHKLPSGEAADTRTFYCPGVGRVLVLVMAQGRWAPGLELLKWSVLPPEAHRGPGAPPP